MYDDIMIAQGVSVKKFVERLRAGIHSFSLDRSRHALSSKAPASEDSLMSYPGLVKRKSPEGRFFEPFENGTQRP